MKIKYAIDENSIPDAIEIFRSAFASKFTSVLEDQELEIWLFGHLLNTKEGIFAYSPEGKLLGIVNYKPTTIKTDDLNFSLMRKKLGLSKSFKLLFLLSGSASTPDPDELFLDYIAVSEEARGLGVGTRLLEEFELLARHKKASRVSLDVVGSNPRAKSLYERFGYNVVKRIQIAPFHKWLRLDFPYYDHMEKKISTDSSFNEKTDSRPFKSFDP